MSSPLRIIFAGTPEFAAVALRALLQSEHAICAVFTQPDRPAGRGRKLSASPVKQLASAHRIQVCQPASLNDGATQDQLRSINADLMVVVAYGLILPSPVLSAPRLGCINIHASLLPRWRGAAPIQRALLAGDPQTGVTIIQMSAGLDTGDMLSRTACPVHPEDTAGTLHDRLARLGADSLLPVIEQLREGKASAVPQDEREARYAPKLAKSEAEMDWSLTARTLDRRVRAFNPWPVAFTTLGDQHRLRIWQARACGRDGGAVPGTIIRSGKEGVDVATGEGALRLLRVQLPGRRPMPIGDFLNAYPVRPGDILGTHDGEL